MIIENYLDTGMVSENSFLITDENTGKSAIVDPSFLRSFDLDSVPKLEYILLTHGHYDHIASVRYFVDRDGAKVVCHKDEEYVVKNVKYSFANFVSSGRAFNCDILLEDGEILELGELKIKLIHTPGHTLGGACYIVEDHIFTGDTVLEGTIGRTDLPTGDYDTLLKSIKKIKNIEGEYILHCGHGDNSTLSFEKENNEFFVLVG